MFLKRYGVTLFLICMNRKMLLLKSSYIKAPRPNGWLPSFIIVSFLLAQPGFRTVESENSGFFVVQAEGGGEWTEIGHLVFKRPGRWRVSWNAQTLMDSYLGGRVFQKSQNWRSIVYGSLLNIKKPFTSLFFPSKRNLAIFFHHLSRRARGFSKLIRTWVECVFSVACSPWMMFGHHQVPTWLGDRDSISPLAESPGCQPLVLPVAVMWQWL